MHYMLTWSLLIVSLVLSQPLLGQIPVVNQHPRLEHDLEESDEGDVKWSQLDDGLKVSFGSTDELYARNVVPQVELRKTLSVRAWRGERSNIQLVLWSRSLSEEVRIDFGKLRSADGDVFPDSATTVHFVRYTLSDHPVGATEFTCETLSKDVHLVPDVLDRRDAFDLPARSVRPVWISVDIPRGAAAGNYKTSITVSAGTRVSESLDLTVNVQPGVVPEPRNWGFRLDLWQNPWAVAFYHDVQPWSEAHIALLRPHLRRLAESGQRFVTTYVSHSPWKDDTHVADSTMVGWTRQPDGTFSFDYRIFDLYVELARECGISDAITAYTMLPWQHRVRYLDVAAGRYVWAQWSPDSEEFRFFWKSFLDDFRAHLLENGWFEKTYIGINENPLKDSLASIKLLKEHSKQWKITYAGNLHEELLEVIDDYCLLLTEAVTDQMIRDRGKRGQTTTFYVACQPSKPNNFSFSPPAEGAWMGWHAFARGYDGFLRWAYDSWTADPLRDTRHAKWAAGDCFLVYPNQRSSIRFERLREGFVDYEKLSIVRERLRSREDVEAGRALEKLDQMLENFTFETVQLEPASETVNAARELLGELTEIAFSGK